MAITQGDNEFLPQMESCEQLIGGCEGMDPAVAELVALASLRQATMSMDDCYPAETFWVTAGWHATAIMVWREYHHGA